MPYKHRPGTDLMKKLMLQDPRVMNIVLKTLIGPNAEDEYTSASFEWIDGRHADILFVPKAVATEALPPIVVKIQNTVDKPFIRRIMKYCNHVIEKYHVEPLALTICINEVRKCISDSFTDTEKAPYLKKLPSDCWAQEHLFMDKNTISAFLSTPLKEMVALGYVLTERQVSLLGLEYRDDATVQMLYEISKQVLEQEVKDEEKSIEVLLNVCTVNRDQYKRILEAMDDDGNNYKRARTYASDGLLYNESCIRKYSSQAASTSSMPEPLELPTTAQASSSNSSKTRTSPLRMIEAPKNKTDMEWVKEFVDSYKADKKKMNWQMCYDQGRSKGFLARYANPQSLKNTFNKLNSKN